MDFQIDNIKTGDKVTILRRNEGGITVLPHLYLVGEFSSKHDGFRLYREEISSKSTCGILRNTKEYFYSADPTHLETAEKLITAKKEKERLLQESRLKDQKERKEIIGKYLSDVDGEEGIPLDTLNTLSIEQLKILASWLQ